MKTNYRSVYTAFDPYPSRKGSAIHIEKASQVLSLKYGRTLLLTLPKQVRNRIKRPIKHLQFELSESNYLTRAQLYSKWVDDILNSQLHVKIGHFRDIWGGPPILKRPNLISVFEVNGLPSIELPDRYSYITSDTREKIVQLENFCLQKSDAIICPSETIKTHLLSRKVDESKIRVISNGATIPEAMRKPAGLPDQYIIYFGALQPWQGVDILLKAMQYLQDKPEIKLVICSSHKARLSKPYQKLATRLGLEQQVIWRHKLKKQTLYSILGHAKASIVPLTECNRNLKQGCSPLKIFESMACKVPLIASDIPVVREILEQNRDARLVRPDRPAELARAIRLFIDYPRMGESLAENAFEKLSQNYTWANIDAQLSDFYDKLVESIYA